MATLLYRLGKAAYRRWIVFLGVWLVLIVGIGGAAGALSKPMVDTIGIPGIPSLKAQELRQELFPGTENAQDAPVVTLVVAAPEGQKLADPKNTAAVQALIDDVLAGPQMPAKEKAPGLGDPVRAAAAQSQSLIGAATAGGVPRPVAEANARALSPLSSDGRIGTMTFEFDAPAVVDVEPASQEALFTTMREHARDSGLQIEANGVGAQSALEIGITSELVGMAIAAVVLILTFGSLVAAGLPLLSAMVGVAIGALGVSLMTAFTEITSTTPVLATMIGIAVGIDYALFILSRYRSELLHTDNREEAAGRAVGTAGSAVVFAGLTVVIALAALGIAGIPFLTAMGVAAAVTVTLAVLVALTFVPALLGALKGKTFAGRVRPDVVRRDSAGRVHNNGVRWARFVGRKPFIVLAVASAALVGLALPATTLHLALPSDSTASSETTQRRAADLISQGFGPGREAPLVVVVDARGTQAGDEKATAMARRDAFTEIVNWARGQESVANAQVVAMNETGDGATVLVTPASGPSDEETTNLLHALRDGAADVERATGTEIGITGLTAIQSDISEQLSNALPIYLGVVVGLAFLLLMIVFRSVLVPLTATLGFLLSVLATMGVTVLVYQEGALGLVEGGPLVSFMPILLIGIVFGLAMDYQVFLVSRMREMYVHGDTAREAIEDGFRHGSRVVAAAAAIMISVFAAFVLQDDKLIASIGFALAAAVFLDAFVVRMAIIPAAMYMLGDRAWWIPAWLDRLIPKVDVEGEGLRPATDWEAELSHLDSDSPTPAPAEPVRPVV